LDTKLLSPDHDVAKVNQDIQNFIDFVRKNLINNSNVQAIAGTLNKASLTVLCEHEDDIPSGKVFS